MTQDMYLLEHFCTQILNQNTPQTYQRIIRKFFLQIIIISILFLNKHFLKCINIYTHAWSYQGLVSFAGTCAQLKMGAYITGVPLLGSDKARTINPKAPVAF
uniref:Uncharacterized protein n=1 Tax=Bactrocera dorsalis TaxID=27457 RepID=A0A034VS18_BACDO